MARGLRNGVPASCTGSTILSFRDFRVQSDFWPESHVETAPGSQGDGTPEQDVRGFLDLLSPWSSGLESRHERRSTCLT